MRPMSEASADAPRRWTVIASGLLLFAIALVVLYAGVTAFRSLLAVVVLAAIGLAAVLLQLRLRPASLTKVRAPQWLNVLGIVFAIFAIFADRLRLSASLAVVVALGAIGCFAVSSLVVLDAIRKSRVAPK